MVDGRLLKHGSCDSVTDVLFDVLHGSLQDKGSQGVSHPMWVFGLAVLVMIALIYFLFFFSFEIMS